MSKVTHISSITLQPAGHTDIPLIRQLAAKIWNQHYPGIISKAQIEYMLNLMYSSHSLEKQIAEGNRFFLISDKQVPAGYLSALEKENGKWFISKFYIDQDKAGKGIGKQAFALFLDLFNPREIKLTVNRQNYKAINFYFRLGFVIEKVADFDIGNGYIMTDFVMVYRRQEIIN